MKPSTREPSQPQTTPPTPTTTPSAAATTAEDEALKKNTDCVYFLASVLTCKKGDDCEYRHSQEARMNPRDCWYWLHRNCLNPSCSFRHPPLDGLVGKTVPPPVKASLPPSLPAASSQLPAANTSAFNPVKQATPCYYFQNGHCLKGDRCAFMHGPQPIDHVALQSPAPKLPTSVAEPQPLQKPVWALEKCNQQKNFRQENAIKQVEVPATVKPPVKVVPASLENGIATKKSLPPISLNDELSRYKAPNVPSVTSGNPVSRTQWGRQAQPLEDRNFRTVKEPEEFLGESSPGFDVLVEDELLEADYYEDDEFGRSKGHGGRHLNSANEIDYVRSAEYNPGAKFDRENYSDSRGYDTYERVQDRYPREQRKTSSERMISDRPYVSERRALPRVESPEQIDELDLRYRLSKQRRINGSRSAVSPDARGDFYRRDDRGRHVEDQRYQGHTRRDSRYLPHESSISNRLHGRISLPGRSSPDRNRNDSHLEKEMDRGRKYARLSPGRPPISSSISGRPQDRIRRRGEDEYDTEGRSFRAPFSRRDEADNSLDFAGPKRLVELKKGGRVSERGDEQQMRGIETSSGDSRHPKIRKFDSHQELEGSTSFEGPKPLREILKRKRQEKTIVSENSTASDFAEVDNQKEKGGNSQIVASEKQRDMASNTKEDTSDLFVSSKEEDRFTSGNVNGTVDEEEEEEEEGLIPEEVEDQQPSVQKGNERETEDMIPIDNGEDEEFETSDQRDAESDYEHVDGDYKTEEDGNLDAEEEEEYEDDEDEDGDDFAKKIGVMFS